MAVQMPRYKVMVDDNFHYQKEDERWEKGVYNSPQEAVEVCRGIVDKCLVDGYRPGISAKDLYEHYAMFGDDPFILVLAGQDNSTTFSARNYAEERCRAICQERAPVPQTAVKEPAEAGEFTTTRPIILAFVAKLKRGLGHVGTILFFYLFVSAVIIGFLKLFGIIETPGPHAGDPCGPGHRYVWVGVGPNSDLSCEPE
jgi:hypothetical protein